MMNRKTLVIIASVLGLAVLFFALNTYRQIKELELKQEQAAVSPSFLIPSFQLTNQEGQAYGTEQLKNQVWVANFIFTRCPGPCLQMTKNMGKVQKMSEKSELRLVSFTVDPDFDTPVVLKKYAEQHGAEAKRWTFLTGAREPLHTLIEKGFKLSVAEATPEEIPVTGPFIHSTLFVVVGKDGKTLGYLDGSSPDFLKKMERLLKRSGGA
jgi:protein SCO1